MTFFVFTVIATSFWVRYYFINETLLHYTIDSLSSGNYSFLSMAWLLFLNLLIECVYFIAGFILVGFAWAACIYFPIKGPLSLLSNIEKVGEANREEAEQIVLDKTLPSAPNKKVKI